MVECTDEATWLCEPLVELTGNPELAQTLDVLLARPATALLIVIGGVLVYRLGVRMIRPSIRRYEDEIRRRVQRSQQLGTAGGSRRAETRRIQRLHAITGAARSGWGILVGFTTFLLAMAQFVDLRPILAGAGLAGIVIGFGAQQMIADLLAGFSMLVEDQYGVGDWIDVDGKVGEVEKVGLRATSFRDLDGTVWHVPNGKVAMVGNLSQRWARATLEIPLPLDVEVAHARRIVSRVAQELAADERWADDIIGPPEIWGVTEWSERGLRLRLVIPTRPLRNWDVNRQMRERLKAAFDAEDIRMAVPMQELSGSPLRSPVRFTDVPPEDPTPPRGGFDPSTTDRLEAETGRLPRVHVSGDDERPVRPGG